MDVLDVPIAAAVYLCGIQITLVVEPDQIVAPNVSPGGVGELMGTAHQEAAIWVHEIIPAKA